MTSKCTKVLLAAFLAASVTLAGCGSSASPTAPVSNTTTNTSASLKSTITLKDILGNQNLSGVKVTVGDKEFTSDGSGVVTVDALEGSDVAVPLNGYIQYLTKYVTGNTTLKLWLLRGRNTLDAVKQMVYGDSSAPSNPGLHSLSRLNGPATIVYPATLGATDVAKLTSGALVLQNASGFPVGVSTTTVPGTANFTVVLDSTLADFANTSYTFSGSTITGGTFRFRDLANTSDMTVRHEFGHGFGLSHHRGDGLLGVIYYGDPKNPNYSEMELDNMKMMTQARPGTVFEYNDRPVVASPSVANLSGDVPTGPKGTIDIHCSEPSK